MTHSRHSVDDLLVTGQSTPIDTPEAEIKADEAPTDVANESTSEPAIEYSDDYGLSEDKVESESNAPTESTSDVDEYGNAVERPKLYTEEDVQRMIRDRLSRGSHRDQQPTQQQVNQVADNFQYDENSTETWQQQLDSFVRQTVQRMNHEQVEQQRKAKEQAAIQAFESKFHAGMARYSDFAQTVADKPITDAMMHGIRGLDNPAAFLYAAAKKQPGELERISKIQDPYQQVAEMGRLHERMRVKRTQSSNAAKPLKPATGDIIDNSPYKRSIDDLIAEHGKERLRR